ncbi:uncharacterized protein CCOS01_12181 [Colletotrichum costaricense]|uniref:Uncharacterized protein n=1 Tax=Colletotrichum costaricense TaxID=1209916 RepID=A0AAI9YP21_9PEZI|nr:uncharacterized protein CCOS01_12181 [Colletotrichum costaricense]KAK1517924.1 hypothetical protein CCOS01_12181 [Colletotrichum costaricense]
MGECMYAQSLRSPSRARRPRGTAPKIVRFLLHFDLRVRWSWVQQKSEPLNRHLFSREHECFILRCSIMKKKGGKQSKDALRRPRFVVRRKNFLAGSVPQAANQLNPTGRPKWAGTRKTGNERKEGSFLCGAPLPSKCLTTAAGLRQAALPSGSAATTCRHWVLVIPNLPPVLLAPR